MADEDETLKSSYIPEHLREDPEVGNVLLQMQRLSVIALTKARVLLKDEGGHLVYSVVKDGRERVEAEYYLRGGDGQFIWRGGHTTRQQDQCIRLHAELSRRR